VSFRTLVVPLELNQFLLYKVECDYLIVYEVDELNSILELSGR
jgi:hypothetical protein